MLCHFGTLLDDLHINSFNGEELNDKFNKDKRENQQTNLYLIWRRRNWIIREVG